LQKSLRSQTTDVRALIVTGSGEKAFSTGTFHQVWTSRAAVAQATFITSGRDLKESANHTPEDTKRYMQLAIDSAVGFQSLPMPTLCAINGHCFGWGIELAVSCDLRFAADEATICFPETGLGIFPGAGGTIMLPRVVPMAVAKELIFTAKRINGQEAQRIGLVTSSVPQSQLLEEVGAIAGTQIPMLQVQNISPSWCNIFRYHLCSFTLSFFFNCNVATGGSKDCFERPDRNTGSKTSDGQHGRFAQSAFFFVGVHQVYFRAG
jgi:enoyl-CoA hydratase/carnithine racemase